MKITCGTRRSLPCPVFMLGSRVTRVKGRRRRRRRIRRKMCLVRPCWVGILQCFQCSATVADSANASSVVVSTWSPVSAAEHAGLRTDSVDSADLDSAPPPWAVRPSADPSPPHLVQWQLGGGHGARHCHLWWCLASRKGWYCKAAETRQWTRALRGDKKEAAVKTDQILFSEKANCNKPPRRNSQKQHQLRKQRLWNKIRNQVHRWLW